MGMRGATPVINHFPSAETTGHHKGRSQSGIKRKGAHGHFLAPLQHVKRHNAQDKAQGNHPHAALRTIGKMLKAAGKKTQSD